MRVYLDNCCLNRPFDDQEQPRIRLEAEAKLLIQDSIRARHLELAWSYVLDYENDANPFPERRRAITHWKAHAVVDVDETQAVLDRALLLASLGIKPYDALHVATAIAGGCTHFLTTDDHLLRRRQVVQDITMMDPLSFAREMTL